MLKNEGNNETEEIGLVTPTPEIQHARPGTRKTQPAKPLGQITLAAITRTTNLVLYL